MARTLPALDPSVKHLVGVLWKYKLLRTVYILLFPTWSIRHPGLFLSAKVLHLPPEVCCLQKPLKYQHSLNILYIENKYCLQKDRELDISPEREEALDQKIHRHRRYPEIKLFYEDWRQSLEFHLEIFSKGTKRQMRISDTGLWAIWRPVENINFRKTGFYLKIKNNI